MGRLSGSLLLLLAAAAIVGFNAGLYDGIADAYQATDIIWTIGTESAVVDSGR
ncbi:hypothetical protein ACQEUX_24055 [Micromonospora sp. CA-259024]|uniref:hypothetical protein n=1 Tax=Micromonospora sp. CA-259024 TaxID=3239965 RepID=UPI003D947F0D